MRIFDIYQHPDRGARAIQRGFSWPAFVAPSVWAAAKGLGTVTLLLVICSTLMFDVLKVASAFVSSAPIMLALVLATYAVFGLKPGFDGNRWHAKQLEGEGYELSVTVAAVGRSHALDAIRVAPRQPRPIVVLTYGPDSWPGDQLVAH